MTLKISGVEPTSINMDGTDVNAVFVTSNGSGTYVWGKPFALSISTDSNVSVVVERTVSMYQNAATGNLSNGSLVYYGDVLKITATPTTNYKVETFTINGNAFTSGESHAVTGAVNIVAASVLDVYWRTVWTGSQNLGFGNPGNKDTGNYTTSKSVTISGIKANVPTRITFGTFNIVNVYEGSTSGNWTRTLGTLQTCGGGHYSSSESTSIGYAQNQSNGYSSGNYPFLYVDTPTSANTLYIRAGYSCQKTTVLWNSKYRQYYVNTCNITKIEQYY